jgi:hypothetical protein
MSDMPYSYLQASGNQMIKMLETIVDAYTHVAIILSVSLLALLLWLCFSELRQSKKRSRMGHKHRPDSMNRPSGDGPSRPRARLEESVC